MRARGKTKTTWSDLKKRLQGFDRAALLGLVQDLYAASKENRTFLNARFDLGEDVLQPYKTTISRWVCPDVLKNQRTSVTKAKRAISDYKKAVGSPEGLAELAVHYCEECADFVHMCGEDDEVYLNAWVRMFETALHHIAEQPNPQQGPFLARLDRVVLKGHPCGYGVGMDMEDLLAEYDFGDR